MFAPAVAVGPDGVISLPRLGQADLTVSALTAAARSAPPQRQPLQLRNLPAPPPAVATLPEIKLHLRSTPFLTFFETTPSRAATHLSP